MEPDEQLEALNVIRSNAPWFSDENTQYFQFWEDFVPLGTNDGY